MEVKITTIDEYNEVQKEVKKLKEELSNIRLQLELSKKDNEKYELLQQKLKMIKRMLAKLLVIIREYEQENLEKKEGKKK